MNDELGAAGRLGAVSDGVPPRPHSERPLTPGAAELDELLANLERTPEHPTLVIPCSPQVIRWLLRGTFVREDGGQARMIGGSIHGSEFTPVFQESVSR